MMLGVHVVSRDVMVMLGVHVVCMDVMGDVRSACCK